MISVDGYKHALKMLEILDMNLDDFLFEKSMMIREALKAGAQFAVKPNASD